ncbi:hypothetical protein MU852_12320 [Brevundimonas albigilva]|uniref:hypothetical protein n=1 Tax=Brevundimonas albigilva TaxID=1312364 RepID=UPI00201B6972|nr:hypothetical protein [Brevundimonas albigilva]UQV17624.1 hypothetical protein MU852_12320 [Brevundimonas albigilva]
MTDADRDNPDAETREFLSHPETAEAGRLIMEAVQREGDRGAMLVAGEMLSAFLGDALRKLQPGALEASDLDRLTKGSARWRVGLPGLALRLWLVSSRPRRSRRSTI